MNFYWRISKYNPKNRNSKEHYTVNEWTSYSDIGRIFNNKKFTKQEYLNTENSYTLAIKSIMACNNIETLTIKKLEKPKKIITSENNFSNNEITLLNKVKNNLTINKEEITTISTLILREQIWCKLINNKKMFVHFGYDYYMYIGSEKECVNTTKKIIQSGLFVEEFVSPYT